jgi:hypothetical protein
LKKATFIILRPHTRTTDGENAKRHIVRLKAITGITDFGDFCVVHAGDFEYDTTDAADWILSRVPHVIDRKRGDLKIAEGKEVFEDGKL